MIVKIKNVEFLMDDEDIHLINGRCLVNCKGYIRINRRCPKTEKNIYLHRAIMSAKRGQVVDHINGNSLDNRKENLRIVTMSNNSMNTIKRKGKIMYRGVYCHGKKFTSQIMIKGKIVFNKDFNCPTIAAIERDKQTRKYFKEYGRYNFPRTGERSAI